MSTLEAPVRLSTKIKWHIADAFSFPHPFKHKIVFYRAQSQAILATTIIGHGTAGLFIVVSHTSTDGVRDVAIAQHPSSALNVEEHYHHLATQVHETMFYKMPPWQFRWWFSSRGHRQLRAEPRRTGLRSYSTVTFSSQGRIPEALMATLTDIFQSEESHD